MRRRAASGRAATLVAPRGSLLLSPDALFLVGILFSPGFLWKYMHWSLNQPRQEEERGQGAVRLL